MINYAHRGASEYAPENTKSAFYLALIQGANGIATDVRRSKDGELILFHDTILDNVTDGKGNVNDLTLQELKCLKVFGNCATDFYDRILTLREFLICFSHYDIQFAIELKDSNLEVDVLRLVEEFGIQDRTTITSFEFAYLSKVKQICPDTRIGLLVKEPDDEHIQQLLSIQGEEICPYAKSITEESLQCWKNLGLSVSAWGVPVKRLLKKLCDMRVDGMTVDYPDRLHQYIGTINCSE